MVIWTYCELVLNLKRLQLTDDGSKDISLQRRDEHGVRGFSGGRVTNNTVTVI